MLAFTNPFILLAAAWTVKGLRAWGVGKAGAILGGGLPWVAWIAAFAIAGGGAGTRFTPTTPVSHEGWEDIEKEVLTLRHPPGFRGDVSNLATILDGFARQIATRFDTEARPFTVHAYPDHATLERATGEFLHVRVTGSVRGRDLLFIEVPGRSAAVPQAAGMRDAVRYVAIMQLAPAVPGAPRWFVEGVAHAAAFPYTEELEREYVTVVSKTGVPTIDVLFDDRIFRTPEGPVLARSLVDFLAFQHGRESLTAIFRDVKGGSPFRDALFSHTRLTTSELEIGWQEVVRATLEVVEALDPGTAAPDSADSTVNDGISPFRPRR